MQSGRNWLGFGDSPQAGPSVWDLASRWGKGKMADKAASMALTAIGGPSAGIAAEAGKELLPQLFASLFNQGGGVQYKDRGGYQEDEMSHRSKNMRVPYPNFMDFAKLTSRNVMTAPSWWEKVLGHGMIPFDYGMSKLKHALHNKDYGLSRNAMNYDDPMVLDPGEVHQSMLLGPLSEIKYKKAGGDVSDEVTLKMAPLSKGE